MKIVVITGSPHRDGTSVLMAKEFVEGANTSGHEVYRFGAALLSQHFCSTKNRT